jgi:hypothetical protein
MSYDAAVGLIGGGPLLMEDLDVTMKVVTYICPKWCTKKEVYRLRKILEKRDISFTVKYKNEPKFHPLMWNYSITVGDRELLFLAKR